MHRKRRVFPLFLIETSSVAVCTCVTLLCCPTKVTVTIRRTNLINEWTPREEILVSSHANLREDKNKFLHDNKHINRRCMGVFVVNLKKALCQAAGVEYIGRAGYNREREASPR